MIIAYCISDLNKLKMDSNIRLGKPTFVSEICVSLVA